MVYLLFAFRCVTQRSKGLTSSVQETLVSMCRSIPDLMAKYSDTKWYCSISINTNFEYCDPSQFTSTSSSSCACKVDSAKPCAWWEEAVLRYERFLLLLQPFLDGTLQHCSDGLVKLWIRQSLLRYFDSSSDIHDVRFSPPIPRNRSGERSLRKGLVPTQQAAPFRSKQNASRMTGRYGGIGWIISPKICQGSSATIQW